MSRFLPLLLACVIAGAWLNQGTSLPRTEALAAEIAADPGAHAFDRARFPLLFLYRQAWDQEIYFAVARALRGLPYDRARLVERGATSLARAPEADGRWHRPYTEVSIEYPALMLPFMVAPSYFADSFEGFGRAFGALMAACLVGAAALAIRARNAAGPGARSERALWWTFSALLLAEGGLAIQRLDAVPALLLAWALWAAAERRHATMGVALGLAAAAKLVPIVLVAPMVAADLAAWRSRRACVRGAVGFGASLGLGLAPMVLPLQGLRDVLGYHGQRGLQVESTWGVLLGAWRVVTGTAAPTAQNFGSYNFAGAAADALAKLATPAMLLAIGAITLSLWRTAPAAAAGEGDDGARRDRIALALLASLAALWLTSKVFSPQYLTWGMPAVLAVSGARGRALTWLFLATTAVTQLYQRGYYDYVTELRPLGVITLLVRLALLGAFAAIALRGLSRARAGHAEVAA